MNQGILYNFVKQLNSEFIGPILVFVLPVAGFLTCLFIGWYVPKKLVRDEFTNWGTLKGNLFFVYLFLVRFVCPVLILLVFLNQLGLLEGIL